MKYTSNYNLKKPEGTDVVNIEDFNDNADIIDAALLDLENAMGGLGADDILLPDGKTVSEKITEIVAEIGNKGNLNTTDTTNLVAAINEIKNSLESHKADKATQSEYGHIRLSDIPKPSKESIGLGDVDNVKQASKAEFDNHVVQKASDTIFGHVKIGEGLSINDGVLSLKIIATPSDNIVLSIPEIDNDWSASGTTPRKSKEIKIFVSGVIRVSFSMHKGPSGSAEAKGRIYINGVPVGTERSTTSTSLVTFTEDIDVSYGDFVQLYGWKSSDDGQRKYGGDLKIAYNTTVGIEPEIIIG